MGTVPFCIFMKETTIAAISTAYGEAGIGIVRTSGPDSLAVLQKIFRVGPASADTMSEKPQPPTLAARHMYYGRIVDPKNGSIVDECLAVYMPGPYSYTGEDVAEIQCHGSVVSYKRILGLLLENGAALAEPGEFTKRAFLNGRLDLAQAEAVIDIIKAKSGRSFETAVDQLSGGLSDRVKKLRAALLDLLVQLSVNMDYPDEDIEEVTYGNLAEQIKDVKEKLKALAETADEGRVVREGLLVSIVGKPNVGKSSLMNLLLKENRSIVTDIPGTTRDTVEEQINVRGIAIRFVDTAGIRESSDVVESIGIERSKDAFNRADLLLLMLDAASDLSEEDHRLLEMASGRPAIVIVNKTDLVSDSVSEKLMKDIKAQGFEVLSISAKTSDGLDALLDKIESVVTGGKVRRDEDVLVTNVRHARLIDRAIEELGEALGAIDRAEAMDFIEVNVNAAFEALGEITGETASGEIIEEVFSRFCLGK